MKKVFKFGCLGILGFVVLIVIIGILVGGEESTEQTSGSSNQGESTPKKDKQEKPKAFKIGDVVNVGDMQYTITEVVTADQVGPSAFPTTASQKYLVVSVTLKNNGNEAVTVDSSFFKLKRGEKTYEADTMGSMSANQSNDGNIDNSFFLQQVNPDSEISGKVVFDVAPEVAEAADLSLQVQTGIFGTETEVINLQ